MYFTNRTTIDRNHFYIYNTTSKNHYCTCGISLPFVLPNNDSSKINIDDLEIILKQIFKFSTLNEDYYTIDQLQFFAGVIEQCLQEQLK